MRSTAENILMAFCIGQRVKLDEWTDNGRPIKASDAEYGRFTHLELHEALVVVPVLDRGAAALVEVVKVLAALILQEAARALLGVSALYKVVEHVVVALPRCLPDDARL